MEISIHAPREGGDGGDSQRQHRQKDFNPRPPRGGRPNGHLTVFPIFCISIHAPREGGDRAFLYAPARHQIFQSTPPARGATACGLNLCCQAGFQSTPPARGATEAYMQRRVVFEISIHAPREGGDGQDGYCVGNQYGDFNPRPPRGGRRRPNQSRSPIRRFQSTPPARGATSGTAHLTEVRDISIHAPREGGDGRVDTVYL